LVQKYITYFIFQNCTHEIWQAILPCFCAQGMVIPIAIRIVFLITVFVWQDSGTFEALIAAF